LKKAILVSDGRRTCQFDPKSSVCRNKITEHEVIVLADVTVDNTSIRNRVDSAVQDYFVGGDLIPIYLVRID